MHIRTFVLLLCLASAAFAGELTPAEFNVRANNLRFINNAFSQPNTAIDEPGTFNIGPTEPNSQERPSDKLFEKLKAEYSLTYEAYLSGDKNAYHNHLKRLNSTFNEIDGLNLPRPLTQLRLAVMEEFGYVPTPTPIGIRSNQTGKAMKPTVVILNTPTPQQNLIPSVSDEQMRGRKNIIYALAEIIWENRLLLGVFIIGILVIYSLYAREESESGFG